MSAKRKQEGYRTNTVSATLFLLLIIHGVNVIQYRKQFRIKCFG